MLCVNSYPKEYIDRSRARIKSQIAAFRSVIAGASSESATAFEPVFFSNLVVVLESSFMHRSRTLEGKDGNALNEVRMLCSSLLQNGGVLAADKSIKYNAAKSVLKLEIGHEIKLTDADFTLLMDTFFAQIESKFLA